ncbi:MAG: hypothetical protein K5707_03490 [Clostridia bacterium]|nr:hypothetical protein [Clostridia bacterium]
MFEVLAPNLGQSNSDVTIEQWFKEVGEHVEKGEPLFEMSNMKLNQEVAASVSGTLVEILVEEGDKTPPKSLIAKIEED